MRVAHLFNRDLSLVFYDLTSSYFEGKGCQLACNGYSREHRPDLILTDYQMPGLNGIELCRSLNREYETDYLSLMPTNLYGPGDNFNLQSSHVIPALIRKFCTARDQDAPTVEVWGTGKASREFFYVDDRGFGGVNFAFCGVIHSFVSTSRAARGDCSAPAFAPAPPDNRRAVRGRCASLG